MSPPPFPYPTARHILQPRFPQELGTLHSILWPRSTDASPCIQHHSHCLPHDQQSQHASPAPRPPQPFQVPPPRFGHRSLRLRSCTLCACNVLLQGPAKNRSGHRTDVAVSQSSPQASPPLPHTSSTLRSPCSRPRRCSSALSVMTSASFLQLPKAMSDSDAKLGSSPACP
ncbi:hypothetical protein N658DRAFT_211627 [Parathielavia hyrcaniae]|uniref:Uncharacterized protein n=1 Tax=Parathielavia hyrcaniae TaxID=113614 RepID=A0AAN6SZT6_9PEZI|nr:hypothetical protein N658DRAFT_211627 [Parathielavia hyrcaniae]